MLETREPKPLCICLRNLFCILPRKASNNLLFFINAPKLIILIVVSAPIMDDNASSRCDSENEL